MPSVTLDRFGARFGVRAGECGATVRDGGIREQTQVGQAVLVRWASSPCVSYLAAPATCPDALRARIRRCRLPACSPTSTIGWKEGACDAVSGLTSIGSSPRPRSGRTGSFGRPVGSRRRRRRCGCLPAAYASGTRSRWRRPVTRTRSRGCSSVTSAGWSSRTRRRHTRSRRRR